jgi:hypothetical protein
MDDWTLEHPPAAEPAKTRDTRPLRWWFVRVDGHDLRASRGWLERAGRVMDEGKGTAADEGSSWFVLRSRCDTIEELRERFGSPHGMVEHIEEIARRSHGWTLASQLPLIG